MYFGEIGLEGKKPYVFCEISSARGEAEEGKPIEPPEAAEEKEQCSLGCSEQMLAGDRFCDLMAVDTLYTTLTTIEIMLEYYNHFLCKKLVPIPILSGFQKLLSGI